jgi:hypothetical protein
MSCLLLFPIVSAALAAGASVYRDGLADPAGWAAVGSRTADGVGDVALRHKRIGEVDCLEGQSQADVPAATLLAVASDVPAATQWSSWDVTMSEVLGRSGSATDYFQVLDNPSPVADRYWFLRGWAETKGAVHVWRWEHIDPTTYPAALARVLVSSSGALGTTVNVGEWMFTEQSGSTEVRYRLCTDVGGSIPRWVGEYAATRTLPTNVADLVKEGRRRSGG